MTALAIALYVVYLLVAFVVRTVIQIRRTGDSGWRGLSGRFGSAEWWAGVLFAVALLVGVAAPIAGAFGLDVIRWLDGPVVSIAGAGLAVAGIALTLVAQLRMGSDWRIGVEATEQTNLVTNGPCWSRCSCRSASSKSPTCAALTVPDYARYEATVGRFLPGLGLTTIVVGATQPRHSRPHGLGR